MLKKYDLIKFCKDFIHIKFILKTKKNELDIITIDTILLKYIANGLLATIVHYSVFLINIKYFNFQYLAVADLVAAFFGISMSFFGNKYFVFKVAAKRPVAQYTFFIVFYIFLVAFHSLTIYLVSDLLALHYNFGFFLATLFQFVISFTVNKNFTFKFF